MSISGGPLMSWTSMSMNWRNLAGIGDRREGVRCLATRTDGTGLSLWCNVPGNQNPLRTSLRNLRMNSHTERQSMSFEDSCCYCTSLFRQTPSWHFILLEALNPGRSLTEGFPLGITWGELMDKYISKIQLPRRPLLISLAFWDKNKVILSCKSDNVSVLVDARLLVKILRCWIYYKCNIKFQDLASETYGFHMQGMLGFAGHGVWPGQRAGRAIWAWPSRHGFMTLINTKVSPNSLCMLARVVTFC